MNDEAIFRAPNLKHVSQIFTYPSKIWSLVQDPDNNRPFERPKEIQLLSSSHYFLLKVKNSRKLSGHMERVIHSHIN